MSTDIPPTALSEAPKDDKQESLIELWNMMPSFSRLADQICNRKIKICVSQLGVSIRHSIKKLELGSEEFGNNQVTNVNEPDDIESPQQALIAMSNVLSKALELANKSHRRQIQLNIMQLSYETRERLKGIDLIDATVNVPNIPEHVERDCRIISWGMDNNHPEATLFLVQGSMISATIRPAANIMKELIEERSVPSYLKVILDKAIYDIVKKAVVEFDPGKDGKSLIEFVRPRVCEHVECCLEQYNQKIASGEMPSIMKWAEGTRFNGNTPYEVIGEIISGHTVRMEGVVKDALGYTDLPQSDLSTAGHNMIKGLARMFDPEIHDSEFWNFAKPYLIAAINYCIAEKRMVIPERTTPEFIKNLIPFSANKSIKKAPPPPEPKVLEPNPPTKEPAKDLSPEEQAEQYRQKSFCKWAKDEHGINLGPDQFEAVVATICDMHASLAKGVVRSIGTSRIRGGAGKVRKMAIQFLPRVVREFDPGEKIHFNQFVKTRLKSILEEEIRK